MRLNKSQMQFIINSDVEEIAKFLKDDYSLSTIEALDKIYNSAIYQKLLDTKTGLYLQSPGYIYSYLQDELKA